MGDRSYGFDAGNLLSDGAAPIIVTGYTQVGGVDGIIDLGGNQSVTPKQQARIDAALVLFITALDTVTGDESYVIQLNGSNDPAFGAGSVVNLGTLIVGGIAGQVTLGVLNALLSVTGMYELSFTNEQANVKYQYLKLRIIAAGTTPSVTMVAFIAEIPRT